MSKPLSYTQAQEVIQACIIAGVEPPSLQWMMGKRKSYGWKNILMYTQDLIDSRTNFIEALAEDMERHDT